MLRIYV